MATYLLISLNTTNFVFQWDVDHDPHMMMLGADMIGVLHALVKLANHFKNAYPVSV